jgi:hypothetical protein
MFKSVVQPSVVSLFSSTGSDPLGLFSVHVDSDLPTDSFVHLLKDVTSTPEPFSPKVLLKPPSLENASENSGTSRSAVDYQLDQTVLHIQSPTLPKTYIQCPKDRSGGRSGDLGLKHPWIHLQVRHMGRDWAFEVGIVDQMGREGAIRCSTFQVNDCRFPAPSISTHASLCLLR